MMSLLGDEIGQKFLHMLNRVGTAYSILTLYVCYVCGGVDADHECRETNTLCTEKHATDFDVNVHCSHILQFSSFHYTRSLAVAETARASC